MTASQFPLPSRGAVREFALTLLRVLRWRLALAVLLPVVLGLTEGLGLVMLLPLLEHLGLDVASGGSGRLASWSKDLLLASGVGVSLASVLGAVAVLSVLRAVLAGWQVVLHPSLDRLMLRHYRDRLYRACLEADWAFAARGRVTDRVHAVLADVEHVSSLTYQAFTITAGVALFAAYLAVAIGISPAMTGLVLACGILLVLLQRRGAREAADASRSFAEHGASLHHLVAESLGGLKTVKSYGAEARTAAQAAGLDERAAGAYVDTMRGYARSRISFEVGSALALVTILFVAIAWLRVTSATLLLLLLLFGRLLPRLATLQGAWQQFETSLPGFERALAVLAAHERHREDDRPIAELRPLERDLRLDAVSFAYGEESVLQDVTLSMAAGRTTAIVGTSGAGKSTIADLLMGLLTPMSGRVLVDGEPVPTTARSWRDRIGYVAQDTVLFNDTIRANLLWAVPDATEARMWDALDAASADYVRSLPQGLDTVVGDRGLRLSGGERQRIALARALLRRPDVLLLDEATSALDSEHERRIQEAIERLHGRVTIVLITHRLTTARHADVIHVIENGRVVESGRWETLTAIRHGRFRAMCAAQHVLQPANR